MGKIYKNQSNLKLTLQTGVTLTGALTTQIGYKKPDVDGVASPVAYWTATIDGTEDLFYEFIDTELDVAGTWAFFAYVVFSDGRNSPGEAIFIKVFEQGE